MNANARVYWRVALCQGEPEVKDAIARPEDLG